MEFDRFSVLLEIARARQKLPAILRSSEKWSILWDYLVEMEFDRFFSSVRNCQKSPAISTNSEKWSILCDFLVMSKIMDIADQPQISARFWPEIESPHHFQSHLTRVICLENQRKSVDRWSQIIRTIQRNFIDFYNATLLNARPRWSFARVPTAQYPKAEQEEARIDYCPLGSNFSRDR